ncbi:hypothetical protein [Anaerovorax odorimutans]|uniref:hypothetical protein n=1 Tax=Anaerovorax odorimutans TaxID=109327 RepID=UPI0003FABBA9|nr:hypothetical protein [Anaerovorax odorimutans]
MRRSLFVLFILTIASLLAGCSSILQQQDNTSNTIYPEQIAAKEKALSDASDNTTLVDFGNNEITPYQFLNLICANAEELSFTYSVVGTDNTMRTFQKSGDVSVETFIAHDMNENAVPVRELEKAGKVHYIMDDSKIIKTYLAPAEDFLLYKMLIAAKTVPDLTVKTDEYFLYEHTLPFEQDESLQFKYRFYMKDGMLKKLTISLGDEEGSTYEFSKFQQELLDITAFEYPKGYIKEEFSYKYTGEHMPPWWEIGNDE